MNYLFGGIALVVIIILGFWKLKGSSPVYEVELTDEVSQIPGETMEPSTRMTAVVDSQEEAENIAELYQMELLSYSYGVAVYSTDKNPQELIEFGKENDYPPISIDHLNHLMEE